MKVTNKISAFSVFQSKKKLANSLASSISSQNTQDDKSALTPAKATMKNGYLKNKKGAMKKMNKKKLVKKMKVKASAKRPRPISLKAESEATSPVENNEDHQVQKSESQEDKPRSNKASSFMYDSLTEARYCFEWLIGPVKPDKFYSELWEKKPLLVKRHQPNYYKGIFSCKEFDRILREKHLQFTKNIDITTYMNGKRETHNPDGRAYAAVVWDYFQNGCSVRLLNPQTFSKSVWKLCSILQEYFGSFVGANVYLTPPGSQGFAPHYDDIEAFVLQLEGHKKWKLYAQRNPSEELPRFSSENFSQEEIGEPILTADLKPGDLLYFPRGIIHQASTPEDTHSLHITLSTCQKNTWGDLMEQVVHRALQLALENDVEFRQSLPRDYMHYMGVANSDVDSPARTEFLQRAQQLFTKLLSFAPVDSAVDQMAKKFIHDSLPPCLTDDDKSCTIHGNGEKWENGRVVNSTELDPDTRVKLIRHGAVRIVMEEDSVRLYHTLENSREYHEYEPQYIDLGAELAPGVEYLLFAYPEYVAIEELPLNTQQQKMELANLLYDKGLLLTEEPLPAME